MAEVNFYLRDNKTDKKTAIILFVSYNNKRVKIATVEHIEPKFWDNANQRVKQSKTFPNHIVINSRLKNIKDASTNAYTKYLIDNQLKEPSTELIKELIKNAINFENNKPDKIDYNFLSFTEKFIEDSEQGKRLNDKGTPIQYNTIKVYKTFKKNLIEFKNEKRYNLSFENIGLEFFEDYKDWMTFKKLYSTNTLSKHIRIMKVIINEAIDKGLTEKGFIGKRYKAKTELTETVYLSKKELQNLYELDLSDKPRLDKVRDLFLVGCWTGLRFSDFSDIKPKDINNGFLTIKTLKTGKQVVIPIHDVIVNIMTKYEGKTENNLPPTISNQKMNEYLKEIAVLAGMDEIISRTFTKAGKTITVKNKKSELISSHSARRSFATNAYLDGIPSITIMAITGHTTESSFMRYIRVTPQEHAEKIKAMWNRESLKVVS